MTDPTLEPLNTNNPTQPSVTPDITMKPVIEPEAVAPITPEPVAPIAPAPAVEPMPVIEPETVHTIQIDEPVAQEPKSTEELTGIQNAQTQEEPLASVQTTGSGKMLKIVIPAAVAVVLGVGGYLVYSLFIAGEEPAAIEETIVEEPVVEEPVTEEPLIEEPVAEEPLEQSLIEGIDSTTESEPVEDYSTETGEDTTPKQKVPRI